MNLQRDEVIAILILDPMGSITRFDSREAVQRRLAQSLLGRLDALEQSPERSAVHPPGSVPDLQLRCKGLLGRSILQALLEAHPIELSGCPLARNGPVLLGEIAVRSLAS